jgi:hypothetical protein
MSTRIPTNAQIAMLLDNIAEHLAAKDENPFRIKSYRTAASSIRGSRAALGKLVKECGIEGLRGIPGVGEKLAGLIVEYVKFGKVELLESLKSEVSSEDVAKVRTSRTPSLPVDLLLAIDAEYREKAEAKTLKLIAPKNYNPGRKAWLPLLVTERKGWRFTVMFSNTARAHELGKTNDWVVIYFEKGEGEAQCTVVTEQRGPLKGKRVIRGRESECRAFYRP